MRALESNQKFDPLDMTFWVNTQFLFETNNPLIYFEAKAHRFIKSVGKYIKV